MPKAGTRGIYMNDDERLEMLLSVTWIDQTTIGSNRVHCRGCGKRISLDKRSGKFYRSNWDKHAARCSTINKAKAKEPGAYADKAAYQNLTTEDMLMDAQDEAAREGVFSPRWQQWLNEAGVVRDTQRFAPQGPASSTVIDIDSLRSELAGLISSEMSDAEIQAVHTLVGWRHVRISKLRDLAASQAR
ncbi:hypothetical protein PM082_018771 [Marasmius tenuissimus]|nr:hypothetical protein PM082_018771 [Marasmius tenuissimus]